MRAIPAFLLLSALTFGQTDQNQGVGAARGQVVDGSGKPISGAVVSFEPTDGVIQGILRTATTDESGAFFLDQIPQGDYVILATKLAEFYPDARFAFFAAGTGDFPKVHVVAHETAQGVLVRLLQKGARLSGTIVDAATGKPVTNARIRLLRQDSPHLSFSSGPDEHGRFDFVVPVQPFVMEVSAPCYRTWSPGTTSAMLLKSETAKEQTVELHRDSAPTACQGG